MRFNRIMRKTMIIISIISLLLTIIFSLLQAKYPSCVVITILNNVSICILTGCFISLIQSIIGYRQSKYDSVYQFYKAFVGLEGRITYFPANNVGFVDAVTGLKEIRSIITYFSENVTPAYNNVDFSNKKDAELNAVNQLMFLYNDQLQSLKTAEDALSEGVEFMQIDERGASQEEIRKNDIKQYEINQKIQAAINGIRDAYNDEEIHQKLNEAYGIIEMYLYGKKVVK